MEVTVLDDDKVKRGGKVFLNIRKFIEYFDLTFFPFYSNFNYNKTGTFLIINYDKRFYQSSCFFVFADSKYVELI